MSMIRGSKKFMQVANSKLVKALKFLCTLLNIVLFRSHLFFMYEVTCLRVLYNYGSVLVI